MSGGAGYQQVDISSFSLEQLSMLKNQFDQEVEQLSNVYQVAQAAISRMEQALISTRAISPDSEGRAMLVPLTGSLYAPGKLVDCDKVLVDVGTGYFVEKSQKEAIAYLVEKLEKLQEREQQVHLTLMRKRESQATVVDLMQKRIAGLSTAKAPVMH